MRFSTLKEIVASTSVTDTFGSYNHNIRIPEGEFYDMKNLTSDYYPVLSPRAKRGTFDYPVSFESHSAYGILGKDKFIYQDNNKLIIDGQKVNGVSVQPFSKDLISFGSYVIIVPDSPVEDVRDSQYVNVNDVSEHGWIQQEVSTYRDFIFTMCRLDGTAYNNPTISATAPSNPTNGDYWIDSSDTHHTLKQYSEASDTWVTISTTYVKVKSRGIADGFKQYDAVKMSGFKDIPQLGELDGQIFTLQEVYRDEANNGAGDYLVITGFLDAPEGITGGNLKIERRMPKMDLIIESGNRLWGCRYGNDIDGNFVNEIYASKLGDFTNWECYMGISTDSYRASCGTDGEWTGAISYNGNPIFFKENHMYRVYGDMPSNFQIKEVECKGVIKGAARSVANLNGRIFFKTRDGIGVYDGSLPSEITQPFGGVKYNGVTDAYVSPYKNGAVAGVLGDKYYISMKSEEDGKWYLFVYDSAKGLWHKEDDTEARQFTTFNGELYYIDGKTLEIRTVNGSGTVDTGDVEWMAETGILGTSIRDGSYGQSLVGAKYVSKMLVRMSMDIGSRAMFYLQYDSCGEWEHVATLTGTSLRTFNIPIKPKRCDHFRLRIVGKGDAKILSITKYIEKGSDMF